MANALPKVDVVLVGFGWTGAIMAQQLCDAGLTVLALERAASRTTPENWATTFDQDELRYMWRHHLFQNVKYSTLTFRNTVQQTALPMRRLGRWSGEDIVEYLRTGRNAHSNAAGTMAEVVSYSTSQMSDADLTAIATYLKSLPASATQTSAAPDPAAMRAGHAIFADACTACHRADGTGVPRLFPRLPGSAVAQQRDPTGVIHLILGGGRTAPTPTRPSFPTMPSFAWKLEDRQIADVATYVRNSWGNQAPPVTADQVADLRSRLKLRQVLTRP